MSFTVARQVCGAEEYDEHRERLPQLRRLRVPPVPPGHLGLIVQAVSVGDFPLRTVYGSVPSTGDSKAALDELELVLRRSLGRAEGHGG
ncbi:MAG: hypothetical protein AB7V58_00200 [Solirubrobacterales bacterium]